MNKQHMLWAFVALVIVSGASFWGGMTYAANKSSQAGQTASRFGQSGARGGRLGGGGNAFGTIVAKDATSITVQLTTGTSTTAGSGSKIVLYDTSTQIGKMVAGSAGDLTVGENVSVSGTANSDGSITAQSIQIRPSNAQRPGGQ
jgi:hypothetical protein